MQASEQERNRHFPLPHPQAGERAKREIETALCLTPNRRWNALGNFPFGVTGNLCDPTYVALPFGLGEM